MIAVQVQKEDAPEAYLSLIRLGPVHSLRGKVYLISDVQRQMLEERGFAFRKLERAEVEKLLPDGTWPRSVE
jgi:hypothetical protein